MKRIGFVGLGVMGHGIVSNILKHGHEVICYDIRPEAAEDLVRQGAGVVDSLEKLGETVDTVYMIVNAYANCRDVVAGLNKTLRGGVIVNMSTISMDDSARLQKQVEEAGNRLVDCPVSGGTRGAAAGTLTVMCAAPQDLYEANLEVFKSFGENIVHVAEEPGKGQALKAVNQLLVGIHMCAAAEAFTMAKRSGLDLQMVYDTVTKSAGNSRIFENRGQFIIDRDFSTRSTLRTQLKDTDIACKTAEAAGTPAFLGNVARELFKLAVGKYPERDDSIEVIRLYEELSREGEE